MKPFAFNIDPDTTVSSHQLEHQLDSCDPLACVLFSHAPSVQMYFALRTRLESSSEAWLKEFISLDGLDSLLDSLGHMCGPQFSGFSDAILQIDCLSCIRAILNSKVGMTSLIKSQSGVEKLLKGVNLVNALPRKHVFEILSAVCVYNCLGYERIMEALEKYRKKRHHIQKLGFIINELKLAETIPHKTSILTFINAIVCSTQDQSIRCRIRNDFAGLGLLDEIFLLQRDESDEDLYVQLQVFQDKMHYDESTLNSELNIDFNCPHDLTDTIQSKVFGGPKMVCFVNILQDLLAVETSKRENSEALWKVLERHIHHLVHATDDVEAQLFTDAHFACDALTAAVESDRLLSNCKCLMTPSSVAKDLFDVQSEKPKRLSRMSSSSSIKKDSGLKTSADSGFIGCEEKISPNSCERNDNLHTENREHFTFQEKRPPSGADKNNSSKEIHTEDLKKCRERENGIHGSYTNLNSEDVKNKETKKHLSVYDNVSPVKLHIDQEVKSPSLVLNGLNSQCQKLAPVASEEILDNDNAFELNVEDVHTAGKAFKKSSDDVTGDKNILSNQLEIKTCEMNDIVLPTVVMRNLKWIKLAESLIEEYPQSVWTKMKSHHPKVKLDFSQVQELFQEQFDHEVAEVPLLSNKTRVCLNLFLERCADDPTELVKKLVRVDGPAFSVPFIKNLADIIPGPDEVKHLKFYNGNLLELGQAEQFILHLSDVPDYDIVLTGQLQKAEFRATASRLRSVLNSMLDSSKLILSNEGLKEVLLLILRLGNFCNHGQYNGYASGFRLASLERLSDLKSKEPGHTFVHYVITCLEASGLNVLSFLKDIPKLERAAGYSLVNIKADFDKMNNQINSFVRLLASANPSTRNEFDSFLEEVKREFRNLQNQIGQLKIQSKSLAAYFCESESFELQHCLRMLLDFFSELRLRQQEVKLLKTQKATAASHTKMFSQQIKRKHLALQFGQKAGASSSMMEEKKMVIDTLLTELHRGNFSPVILRTMMPPAKSSADKATASFSQPRVPPLASTLASMPSITPVQSAPCIRTGTPERHGENAMELSRISLMGTPMMNRPNSELFDEEITITASKPVTSSENDLLDGPILPMKTKVTMPLMPAPKPLTKSVADHGKGHYRSRSDLADSINVHEKWIRYHDQLKLENAPLAKPESSIMMATLNLEPGSSTRHLYMEAEAMALIKGPTVALPPPGNCEGEANKHGKKSERRSTISRMINKISRRVLKPRNVDVDNMDVDENSPPGDVRKMDKRQAKMEKVNSLGRAAGLAGLKRESEKENICYQEIGEGAPFERQTKNPIRLSNRFKNKFIK